MPRNGCHGADALCNLGEIGERGVAQVSEREVLRSLFADHQGSGLPQRPAVVVAAEDEAFDRSDCFELQARKRSELEGSSFAFLIDLRRDPNLEITELVVVRHPQLLK